MIRYSGVLSNPCPCSPWDRDRIMSPDMEAAHALVRQRQVSVPNLMQHLEHFTGCVFCHIMMVWVFFCCQVWRTVQPYMDEYRKKLQAWIILLSKDSASTVPNMKLFKPGLFMWWIKMVEVYTSRLNFYSKDLHNIKAHGKLCELTKELRDRVRQ